MLRFIIKKILWRWNMDPSTPKIQGPHRSERRALISMGIARRNACCFTCLLFFKVVKQHHIQWHVQKIIHIIKHPIIIRRFWHNFSSKPLDDSSSGKREKDCNMGVWKVFGGIPEGFCRKFVWYSRQKWAALLGAKVKVCSFLSNSISETSSWLLIYCKWCSFQIALPWLTYFICFRCVCESCGQKPLKKHHFSIALSIECSHLKTINTTLPPILVE